MKILFLICACFLAITCSQRSSLSEYNDFKNGLHVEVPNNEWVIGESSGECEKKSHCWYLVTTDGLSGIGLSTITQTASPVSTKDLDVSINQYRKDVLKYQSQYPDDFSQVSQPVVSSAGNFVWISWNGLTPKGVFRISVAYLRLAAEPTKLYLFFATAPLFNYRWQDTERDFVVFLNKVSSATAASE